MRASFTSALMINFIFIPKTRAKKVINRALQPTVVKKYKTNILLKPLLA